MLDIQLAGGRRTIVPIRVSAADAAIALSESTGEGKASSTKKEIAAFAAAVTINYYRFISMPAHRGSGVFLTGVAGSFMI